MPKVEHATLFFVLFLFSLFIFSINITNDKFDALNRNINTLKYDDERFIIRNNTVTESISNPDYEEFEATAYTHNDEGCNRLTKTEFYLTPQSRIVAVDPSVIPLGSIVEIKGYGIYYALDIGGSIKGNRIDIYHWDRSHALEFGRRKVFVRVLLAKEQW